MKTVYRGKPSEEMESSLSRRKSSISEDGWQKENNNKSADKALAVERQ